MARILIVEDDRNLQSIYGDRLKAEGHTIITASDGEEALAVAVKEKPDLIISDVMMPKISGFDMLDILRTTPETRNVKIIMMTALSQAEDRERANKLGADKYLVKSQVTLDDVAATVNEIVGATGAPSEPASSPTQDATTPASDPVAQPDPTPAPATDDSTQPAVDEPQAVADSASPAVEEQAKISSQIDDFLNKNVPEESPASPAPEATTVPVSVSSTVPPASPNTEPAVTPGAKPNIFELYEQEMAKEATQTESPKEPDSQPKS